MTADPTGLSARQVPAWAATIGPGWTALPEKLHYDLRDPAYRLKRFGTQFGGLRSTVADRFQAGEFRRRVHRPCHGPHGHRRDRLRAPVRNLRSSGSRPLARGERGAWMQARYDTCCTCAPRRSDPTGSEASGPVAVIDGRGEASISRRRRSLDGEGSKGPAGLSNLCDQAGVLLLEFGVAQGQGLDRRK